MGLQIIDAYREGKRKLVIPLNGIQYFEIRNLDSRPRKFRFEVISFRFVIVGVLRTAFEDTSFEIVLPGGESLGFAIRDMGSVKKEGTSNGSLEGTVRLQISKEPLVPGQPEPPLFPLQELLITMSLETDSYRKFRSYKDKTSHALCPWDETPADHPLAKLVKIQEIGKEKYEKGRKLKALSKEEEEHNLKMADGKGPIYDFAEVCLESNDAFLNGILPEEEESKSTVVTQTSTITRDPSEVKSQKIVEVKNKKKKKKCVIS